MVENITSGVVSLDAEGRVLMHNKVAAELLGVRTGEPLSEALAARPKLAPVAGLVAEAAAGDSGSTLQRTVRLPGDDGEEREWSLVWVPVPGPGEPAALLVVEDATETLRGQRLQAWAEMARIIAHEIKNPLTPLRLNVEHLRQVWRDRGRRAPEPGDGDRFGEILDRCTAAALTQVEELRQIASEFSTYSSIPRIDPRPGDLAAAMRELGEAYRAAPPPGVAVEFEARPDEIAARFDRRLLVRAVRNLLENALRASAGGGRVRLSVERIEPPDGDRGAAARIAVADAGPGVAPDLLGRIFHPYFSTHDTGTGLGLPIARQIAEEHGGSIAARNRPEGGLEVAITIPLP
jgi:two-component system nitrogen regulation sensor histidine kinase NtrY